MTTEEVAAEYAEGEVGPDSEEGLYETITVGDLGVRLVTGTGPMDGSGPRDIRLSFLDWTAKDERELAAFRRKHKGLSQAAMVVHVLSRFAARWGEHDFTRMSSVAKEAAFGLATAADVFHAWCQLRVENLGGEVGIQFECMNMGCGKEIQYTIDIESVEVAVPRSLESDLTRDYKLRKGIQYLKQRRKGVKIAPLRWKTHKALGGDPLTDISEIKLAIIEGTVIGIDGVEGEIVLPPTSIDTMVKYDIEHLFDFIEEESPGPDLSIKLDCPYCGITLTRPMRWEYDLFFSA